LMLAARELAVVAFHALGITVARAMVCSRGGNCPWGSLSGTGRRACAGNDATSAGTS
jgi:hypothetical protein